MEISVHDYARECAEQGLRGDYSVCRSDFTVAQSYDYDESEQAGLAHCCATARRKLTERLAHRSYLDGVADARPARPHPRLRRRSATSCASSPAGRSSRCRG